MFDALGRGSRTTSHIVVAFRMTPAGMMAGPEGAYLVRARSMCARGEALGGRLVAWSAALLAMAWDSDSIEEALLLATSLREPSVSPERGWSSGVAEGELEPLAPDDGRMHLAWGAALASAASLARIAKPGELLVDGDMRAVRAGQLNLLGSWTSTDAGQRVRGWRLDLEHPWKRAVEAHTAGADATDRYPAFPLEDDSIPANPNATLESEVVEPHPGRLLAERVRKLAEGDVNSDAAEALAELRRARTRAEGKPAASRCQAVLALAMALAIAGRTEESLLEALEALARAREAEEPKAVGACMALLAKLYSFAGLPGEASALRESCGA
jgi:hypothetical protein